MQTFPTTRYPAKTVAPHPCHYSEKDQPGWNQVPSAQSITPQPRWGISGTIEPQREAALPGSDHPKPGDRQKRAQARYDAQESSGAHPHLDIRNWCFAPNSDPSEFYSSNHRPDPPEHTRAAEKPQPRHCERGPGHPEDFPNAPGSKENASYIHPSHVGR